MHNPLFHEMQILSDLCLGVVGRVVGGDLLGDAEKAVRTRHECDLLRDTSCRTWLLGLVRSRAWWMPGERVEAYSTAMMGQWMSAGGMNDCSQTILIPHVEAPS